MKKIIRLSCLSCFIVCIISCSTTKFVGEDQYLLDKVKITVEDDQVKTNELKPYLRQEPNFKIFGILKWPLYVYNWSGRNENNWWNKQLRRIGEPPEIMDTVLVSQSKTQLKQYMINKGYLHSQTMAEIDTSRQKKATIKYHIIPNEPYCINQYRTSVEDVVLDSIIHLDAPRVPWYKSLFSSSSDEYTPLVRTGQLFDRDILDKERQRLTTMLRRRGYYAFNRDYIYFVADSTKKNWVDLEMFIKPFQLPTPEGDTKELPHQPYYIGKVNIITDYDPLSSDNHLFSPADSVFVGDIGIYYGKNRRGIRPSVLRRRSYFKPGQLYNEWNAQQTYSAFSALQALRHVNIKYQEFEENDSLKLNCTIYTAPAKTQGFGVDVEGTNSDGDLGFATSLNYQHRNIFRGSELFSAKIRGAYEYLSTKESGEGNYWELAGETSILFPTFVLPFISNEFRRKVRATTELKLSYNHQRRPEYQRAILSGGWSYIWQDRVNSLARHTFKLLDVNYVYLPEIKQEFKDSLPANIALYNYSDQFIVSTGYIYSFNNYDPLKRGRNTYSLRVGIELAGNVLYGLSRLFDAEKDENGRYKLFGINYSQYIKGDIDFARSLIIDERNSFAFHIGGGIGYPYGNRKEMPFERSYFSGGANSNRGWSVRTLGPGSMPIDKNTTFVNQVGDIRFDINMEYRSKLFWRFEMAAFVDAGNIWTIRSYEHQPKGNFDFARFYKEIAMSYGLGLRLDFDYFLLRFDTGLKAFNPQESGSRKWAVTRPNLHDNFAWHFAVGYPF